MVTSDRVSLIRQRLEQQLIPERLEIQDDSWAHAGHAGARGGGHFTVTVIAAAFTGKSLVQRHRMVYAALADLMPGEIHALSINALTPEEQ